jgi:hypothetical protein
VIAAPQFPCRFAQFKFGCGKQRFMPIGDGLSIPRWRDIGGAADQSAQPASRRRPVFNVVLFGYDSWGVELMPPEVTPQTVCLWFADPFAMVVDRRTREVRRSR